jgi:putative Holliday junction resolvase
VIRQKWQRRAAGQQLSMFMTSLFWENLHQNVAGRVAGCSRQHTTPLTSAPVTLAMFPSRRQRIAGDLGTKTLGTATCDAGFGTLPPRQTKPASQQIPHDCIKARADSRAKRKGLVIGLPRTWTAAKARELARRAVPMPETCPAHLHCRCCCGTNAGPVSAESAMIGQFSASQEALNGSDSHAAAIFLQAQRDGWKYLGDFGTSRAYACRNHLAT